MRSHRDALAPIFALACFSVAGPAEAQDDGQDFHRKFQPYRAVYELRPVAKAGASVPFTIKSARMTTEARLGCKEAESLSSFTLSFVGRGGHIAAITVEEKMQESRDGRVFRRTTRIIEEGREVRRHEAQATLETRDGPGTGTVTRGAPETLKLPRGTVLPGTHNLRAIEAKAAGKTETKHRVFLGEDDFRVADITTTVIGSGTAPASAALGEYAGKPGRTVRDTVRGVGPQVAGQTRVSEAFITDEGVMTSISFTVKGLELQGTAVKLEKLPKPTCP